MQERGAYRPRVQMAGDCCPDTVWDECVLSSPDQEHTCSHHQHHHIIVTTFRMQLFSSSQLLCALYSGGCRHVAAQVGANDPTSLGPSKYLIQWRRGGSANRLWVPAPTDEELVTTKYRWYSLREPTASGTSSSSQPVEKEETETVDKSESPGPHRRERYQRAQRQHNVREVFRYFTTDPAEAAVKKNRFLFLGIHNKQMSSEFFL